MHQPRSAANFRSSFSDIARKILSSAGCVMKISGFTANAAEIFAINGANSSLFVMGTLVFPLSILDNVDLEEHRAIGACSFIG